MDYKVWETCFLLPFGLSRGECASWVQAWGSILAIVGTAGAAIYQARRQYQSTMAGLRLQQKQAHLQVAETLEQLATNTLKLQQHIAEKLTTREAVKAAADDGLPFDLPELRSLERSLESVASATPIARWSDTSKRTSKRRSASANASRRGQAHVHRVKVSCANSAK